MPKKALAISAAVASLFILAIPATASAVVTLREAGTTVALSETITFTQDGSAIFQSGSNTWECNEIWTTGSVVKNNGTNVEVTIEGAKFQSNLTTEGTKCKSNFGNMTFSVPKLTNEGGTSHWCMKSIAGEDTFELLGKGCGAGGGELLEFVTTWAGGTCVYKRELPLRWSFTTTSGGAAATVQMTGSPEFVKVSGLFCAATFQVVQWRYQLYTDTISEQPLQFDDVL